MRKMYIESIWTAGQAENCAHLQLLCMLNVGPHNGVRSSTMGQAPQTQSRQVEAIAVPNVHPEDPQACVDSSKLEEARFLAMFWAFFEIPAPEDVA